MSSRGVPGQWWLTHCALALGCDAPEAEPAKAKNAEVAKSGSADAEKADVKKPDVKKPDTKKPDAKKPDAKKTKAEPVPPPVETPEPCRVIAVSYAAPTTPDGPYERTGVAEVVPATSLTAWRADGEQAPPVLVAGQLPTLATRGNDGRWMATDAPLSFALDHEDRLSLAIQTKGLPDGTTLRQFIYRYRCEPAIIEGAYPGNEEATVYELAWASSKAVPLHDGIRGSATGRTAKGRPKAKLRPKNTAVVVVTPQPIIMGKDLKVDVYPNRPGAEEPPEPIPTTFPIGTTIDHLHYEGEGTCLYARGDVQFFLTCLADDIVELGPDLETPAESEFWVRPGKKDEWLLVDEEHFSFRLKELRMGH